MHPRCKKANDKWQKLAEGLGYPSEKALYLAEFKDKNTIILAKKMGVSANTLRYRVQKLGFSLYENADIIICGACKIRPCTPPDKNVCLVCQQTDIEPGYEQFG